MEQVLTAIAQVGFPIVACLLLWKALADERDSHKQEMTAITDALCNNTKALVHLSDVLGADCEGGKHLDN